MRIEHVALWVKDLEPMRDFYVSALGAQAGERYENQRNRFASYFLSFDDGARLELMQMPGLAANGNRAEQQALGFVHLALATGSAARVDAVTAELEARGCPVLAPPHLTGDGYYESVVLDPEGNRIEITI